MHCAYLVAQSCPTLCDSDCGLPGSSVHGIFQARILEQVAIPFSRGSSQPRNLIHISFISCNVRQMFHHSTTWETALRQQLGSQLVKRF